MRVEVSLLLGQAIPKHSQAPILILALPPLIVALPWHSRVAAQ